MDRRALTYRVLTAVVGIPLLLTAAWLGEMWWGAVIAMLSVAGAHEYGALLRRGFTWSAVLGIIIALTIFLLSRPELVIFGIWIIGVGTIMFFSLAVLPLILSGDPRWPGPLGWPWSGAILGWIYLGVGGGALAELGFEKPFLILLWFFSTIWASTVAAYFAGHAVGRHKLAPRISPGKTWEGAIAGLVAGAAVSLAFASFLSISIVQALLAGGLVTIAEQFGDLFESAIKRRAGVKDSGVIFPGHGGVLDRFDGVFAAAPVAYLLLHWWAP